MTANGMNHPIVLMAAVAAKTRTTVMTNRKVLHGVVAKTMAFPRATE